MSQRKVDFRRYPKACGKNGVKEKVTRDVCSSNARRQIFRDSAKFGD